jgi:hypothetical protein
MFADNLFYNSQHLVLFLHSIDCYIPQNSNYVSVISSNEATGHLRQEFL